MKIYFRMDFGRYIGLGHLSRCLVLADLFTSKNHTVCFLHHAQEDADPAYVRGHQHEILGAGLDPEAFSPNDYDTWLGNTQEQECHYLSKFVTTPAIWIIDHYGISSVVEEYLKNKGQHVVVIDDLKRTHYADIIIDYSTGSTPEAIHARNTYPGETLSGKEFCIASIRYASSNKESYTAVKKIIVNLGSTTQENILKVCQALDAIFEEVCLKEVQVLHKSGRPQEFRSKKNFHFIASTPSLERMNLEADLVIGSFGVALVERLIQHIPCVNFLVVDNQMDFSRIFQNDDLHRFYGDLRPQSIIKIQEVLRREIQRLNTVITQNPKCTCGIDGQGAFRILDKLETKFGRKN